MTVYEFLFWRGFVQLAFMGSVINTNANAILVKSITKDMILPLSIRVFAGVTSFFLINKAIQSLPIFVVSLVINLAPIFTSILAFIFLKERISRGEVFALCLAFAGVYMLISASSKMQPQQPEEELSISNGDDIVKSNITIIPLLMLVAATLLMATTNIMLRKMKKMHEFCSATYTVMTSLVFFGIGIKLSSQPMTIADTFSPGDYTVMIFIAVCGILGLLCKTKAMQYEMASRLSILIYFNVIFSLVFDLILIGTVFRTSEVYGMLVIFLANAMSVYVIFSKFYTKQQDNA